MDRLFYLMAVQGLGDIFPSACGILVPGISEPGLSVQAVVYFSDEVCCRGVSCSLPCNLLHTDDLVGVPVEHSWLRSSGCISRPTCGTTHTVDPVDLAWCPACGCRLGGNMVGTWWACASCTFAPCESMRLVLPVLPVLPVLSHNA